MSEETISEEQVLHNKLSFEINQELIHLMKRIIEIQQENKQLKEVIAKVREYTKKEIEFNERQIEAYKTCINTNVYGEFSKETKKIWGNV